MSQVSLSATKTCGLNGILVVAFVVAMGTWHPTPARAAFGIDDAFYLWLGKHLAGEALNYGVDSLVVRPREVRQMQRELDDLAKKEPKNATEILKLRRQLKDGISRKEVERLLVTNLAKQSQKLAEHEVKLGKHESRIGNIEGEMKSVRKQNAEIRRENTVIKHRLARVEDQLRSQGSQLRSHGDRLDAIEPKIKAVTIEVTAMAVSGFHNLKQRKHSEALQDFEDAIQCDPTDPGFFYGKSLALKQLGKDEEAVQSVLQGVSAERRRSPGAWYFRAVQRVDQSERDWLEATMALQSATVKQPQKAKVAARVKQPVRQGYHFPALAQSLTREQ